MKRIFIFIACAFGVCNAFSQYDANWAFGNETGLFFGEDTITPFESSISGFEAQASISDSSGNLLFYTNGQNVWNSEHELMLNGTALNIGQLVVDSAFGSSITQGVIIVPKPLSKYLYYIFYLKNSTSTKGLSYAIVDMSLNEGMGELTYKNINLNDFDLTEKMQAVKHANGRDWWLINIKYAPVLDEDSSYKFIKYLITPTEIEGPFIQDYGPKYDFNVYFTGGGQMSFNKMGSMLANTRGLNVDLFAFDRCTGLFSDLYTIEHVYEHATYGCEFSADGNKLYIVGGTYHSTNKTELVQYCLNCKDEIIDSTRFLIYKENFDKYNMAQLQMGPDNKIYVAMGYYNVNDYEFDYQNMNLSVINSPNNLGLSCDFSLLSISLEGNGIVYGLPNLANYNLGALAGSGCDTVISGLIDSDEIENVITMYPNPAEKYIMFKGNFDNDEPALISISDISGKEIIRTSNVSLNMPFTLSPLRGGIYFIKVEQKDLIIYQGKLFILNSEL